MIMGFEKAKEVAKQNGIPVRLNLQTRTGKVETVLDLYDVRKDKFVYRVGASYPYNVTYMDQQKELIKSIDFSEGPMISVGDIINKTLRITKIWLVEIEMEKI